MHQLTNTEIDRLLFLHSVSGSDTTSAPYQQGKVKLFKMLSASSEYLNNIFGTILSEGIVEKDELERAGLLLFQCMYKEKYYTEPLPDLRVKKFFRLLKHSTLRPELLPPTEEAASQHILRSYLQFVDWRELVSMYLQPEEYGWVKVGEEYQPIGTTIPIAPDELLKIAACNCSSGRCRSRCTCKSQGIDCIDCCGCAGNCSHEQ